MVMDLVEKSNNSRFLSSALLPFFREGSPTKIDPYSILSTGGPRLVRERKAPLEP